MVEDGGKIALNFEISSKDYFNLCLSSYSKNIYRIIYNNGTWTKAMKILESSVDDNNKNSLTLSGDLTVNGTINGTASSAGVIKPKNKIDIQGLTVPEIKEIIINQVKLIKPLSGMNNYTSTIVLYGNMLDLIQLWNTNNNTDTVAPGTLCTCILTDVYTEDYFRIILSTYDNEQRYETIMNVGNWSKFRKIYTSSVNDNNENSLVLNGDLTVDNIELRKNTIKRNITNNYLRLMSGNNYNTGAHLMLYGKDYRQTDNDSYGKFSLEAYDNQFNCSLVGKPTGELIWNFNDLGGSAIVAKFIGENGYIKYASGLLIQWGRSFESYARELQFPIAFTNTPKVNVTAGGALSIIVFIHNTQVSTAFYLPDGTIFNGNITWNYIAIGY